MKNFIAFFIAIIMCLSPMLDALASKTFSSIATISSTTPERWTATYDTKWRTVSVDVPISVPQVDSFPILCVKISDPISKDFLSSYQNVKRNSPGYFEASTSKSEETIQSSWRYKSMETFPGTAKDIPLPENVTIPFSDVYSLATREIDRLFDSNTIEYYLDDIVVMSCHYRFSKKGSQITWHEQKTNTGKYILHFRPLFHGIGYQAAEECYDKLRLTQEKAISDSRITFTFYNNDNFKILALLYNEIKIKYEDVPLLSFDDAKASFEELITAGILRSVDTVELCYIPYLDPQDKDMLWLLPAWYLRGGYSRDPEREFVPYTDKLTGEVLGDGVDRVEIIYQAQLGTLLDYYDSRKTRRNVPKILTWDNIK